MRKIIGLYVMTTMLASSVMWSTPVLSAPLTMGQIYGYAKNGNVKALKSLGKQVDSIGRDGNTNLCRAVYNHYYRLNDIGLYYRRAPPSQLVFPRI